MEEPRERRHRAKAILEKFYGDIQSHLAPPPSLQREGPVVDSSGHRHPTEARLSQVCNYDIFIVRCTELVGMECFDNDLYMFFLSEAVEYFVHNVMRRPKSAKCAHTRTPIRNAILPVTVGVRPQFIQVGLVVEM